MASATGAPSERRLHDWTLDEIHLCNVRLRLLRLNTMPAGAARRGHGRALHLLRSLRRADARADRAEDPERRGNLQHRASKLRITGDPLHALSGRYYGFLLRAALY